MRHHILPFFILFLLHTILSATETRIVSLGQSRTIPDESNIFYNPSLINHYHNLFLLEVGDYTGATIPTNQYALFSLNLPLTNVGIILNRNDERNGYFFHSNLNNMSARPARPVALVAGISSDVLNFGILAHYASYLDSDRSPSEITFINFLCQITCQS